MSGSHARVCAWDQVCHTPAPLSITAGHIGGYVGMQTVSIGLQLKWSLLVCFLWNDQVCLDVHHVISGSVSCDLGGSGLQ